MKLMKKTLPVLLMTALLLTCMPLSGSAYTVNYDSSWSSYYDGINNTLPRLTPGADETQLYISWHSAADAPQGHVKITDNIFFGDVQVFDATSVPAETDAQRVNQVILTGLSENTTYFYWYTLDDGSYSTLDTFTTRDPSDFTVLVAADAQIGSAEDGADKLKNDGYNWNTTIEAALKTAPDLSFILHNGDQTQTGVDANEWVGFYSPSALRSIPIAPVIGNHDKKGLMYKYYTFYPNAYPMEYPSDIGNVNWYRYGDVLFVNFDSTNGSAADQYACAKAAIDANPDVKWRVACMHHDLYGSTDSAGSAESTILFENIFRPIYDEFGFDIVFTGHSHTYGRSKQMYGGKVVLDTTSVSEVTDPAGTVYVSSGCSGDKYCGLEVEQYDWTAYRYETLDDGLYTLVNFDSDSLTLKTYRTVNGELVDQYTINKTVDRIIGDGTELNNDMMFSIVKTLGMLYMFFSNIAGLFENVNIG